MSKILVVDDDSQVVDLLKSRLMAHGYEVITATDGADGFAKACSQGPDLIIMDVSMPKVDGFSALQELQSRYELRHIPVLVLTGDKTMRDIFEPMRIVSFMTKPFDAVELLGIIERTLGAVERKKGRTEP